MIATPFHGVKSAVNVFPCTVIPLEETLAIVLLLLRKLIDFVDFAFK